ncbi:hypothetical protein FKP32DRAFT_507790 [Trametes sanguinea]|nr:hypothetical protein FKP32DRAFT_507790 [Trametes sanguinea]
MRNSIPSGRRGGRRIRPITFSCRLRWRIRFSCPRSLGWTLSEIPRWRLWEALCWTLTNGSNARIAESDARKRLTIQFQTCQGTKEGQHGVVSNCRMARKCGLRAAHVRRGSIEVVGVVDMPREEVLCVLAKLEELALDPATRLGAPMLPLAIPVVVGVRRCGCRWSCKPVFRIWLLPLRMIPRRRRITG